VGEDFDDLRRMQAQLHRERFEKFREAFESGTFDQLFPGADAESRDPRADQVKEVLGELLTLTTDSDPGDVLVRALVTYQAIVRHVRSGGTVQFQSEGTSRTLRVRIREEK